MLLEGPLITFYSKYEGVMKEVNVRSRASGNKGFLDTIGGAVSIAVFVCVVSGG
jgi:hypothetical protein